MPERTFQQPVNVDICFLHNAPDCEACKPKPAPTEAVELDGTMSAWVEAIRAADAEIARLTGIRGRAIEHIQAAMGDAIEARIGGQPVITWKPAKASMRLDRKALEVDLGTELVEKYLRPSAAARPFKVLPPDGA